MDDLETTLQNVDPLVWIVVAIVAVIVIVAVLVLASRKRHARTERLRSRFGQEYDRTVEREGSTAKAEKVLEERLRRRERFALRELSTERRHELLARWEDVQASFVDGPESAVRAAEVLVDEAARDRGYPDADPDQRLDDLAFDHSDEVHRYRTATATDGRGAKKGDKKGDVNEAEMLRGRMLAARELFESILGPGDGRRATSSRDAPEPPFEQPEPRTVRNAPGTDEATPPAAGASRPGGRSASDGGRGTDPRGEPLAGTPPRSEEHTVEPPPPRSEERTITPPPPPMPDDR